MSEKLYLTEKEAANITGLSVHWFRRKRWSGGGPEYIQNDGCRGAVRYEREALTKYFQNRTRKSTSDQGQTA
jgi:hypothetical protein